MNTERELVLQLLLEEEKSTVPFSDLLKELLQKYDFLRSEQKAFIKRVAVGCIDRRITLDFVLDSYASRKVSKMKPLIRELLRMGAYQLLFMDRVPDSAAVNETVKLAAQHGFSSLRGFVNGVLRTIARQKEVLSFPNPSIRYSMPGWIVDLWEEEYGQARTAQICEALLCPRPVTIRLDERLSSKEREIEIALLQKEAEVKKTFLPYALSLSHTDNLSFLPGYQEGLFAIQDVSSMLVTELAGLTRNATVVDVCAAPGGKSLHAATKLAVLAGEHKEESGQVFAYDLTEKKCEKIREGAERLRLHEVVIAPRDATQFYPDLVNQADFLYCDLPCSGLGVIGRKPEIKYRLSPEDIDSLVLLQRKILRNTIEYLKPGGILMYSTCTISRKENEENVDWILKNLPLEGDLFSSDRLGSGLYRKQLLPGEMDTDGFFIAKFRKK